MGKSESAEASLGIKILLSDLISQIDQSNLELIRYMLQRGSIEDENETINDEFIDIINSDQFISLDKKNHLDFKEYLTKEFNKTLYHYGITRETLIHQSLLIPIKNIHETTRWGYDRYGTNATSTPIDFDLSVDIEKYKDIKNFEIVFILTQHSG